MVGVKEMVTAGAVAEPVRLTVCGEPMALSVAVRLALAVPSVVGRNSMERVQLWPAASEVSQVLPTMTNSPALVPVKA